MADEEEFEVEAMPVDDEPAPAKPAPAAAAAPSGDQTQVVLEEVPRQKHEPYFSAGTDSKMPKEKLMTSDGIIPFQSGTNIYDSQKGITGFGRPRDVMGHIKGLDIFKPLTEEKERALNDVVRLQSGTNKFDSQKGMAMGTVRDVLYKPVGTGGVEAVSEEKARIADGIIPLQSGTNKLASQAGMRGFGMPRLTFTKELLNPHASSQGVISPQAGTNKLASQNGMTAFGMPRSQLTASVDEARGALKSDERSFSKQSCGSQLSGNSQAGMGMFGSFRAQTNMSIPNCKRLSQGFVPFQAGINWGDSQQGKTPFGMPRTQTVEVVDDTREPLPDTLARDKNVPSWSSGYQFGASQVGMTAPGTRRDCKGQFLHRLW